MIDFQAPYTRTHALSFLSKFLPEDFKKIIEENIPLNFKSQFIERVNKLGESDSLQNLHVFEVVHSSENDPRISLSREAFRILANFGIRKAIIFFISKKSPNYRFSFVTLDLKWDSGKRVDREYSNPRRYSFFLGPDAKTHTPADFLIRKGMVKNVEDLISRFDVEVVTKEFFQKYKKLFEDLQKFLSNDQGFTIFANKNGVDIDAFSKKILGQIVFCYFLQKKGWLGAAKGDDVNMGDRNFIRSLFVRSAAEKKNFYNKYLEYLFYDSLNMASERAGDFFREYLGCQVPFLNGGLFEPLENYDWRESLLHIPDSIFSNKQGSGILDVFDLYNFTVYEDDPVDREVSVDPEMLGKVFENLLPENLRKGQGSYYTPREIVHYMCQESLINYLVSETGIEAGKVRNLVIAKINPIAVSFRNDQLVDLDENQIVTLDKALANIKACDPACGSGAFLVGMLHEIVLARQRLNPKKSEYGLKKEAIQNSIYGVDIDPGAVDIAKLRLWLSLVVDYSLEDIEPLPNLDYKIMCGNSLLEALIIGDETIKLFDERLLEAQGKKKVKTTLFNETNFDSSKKLEELGYLQKNLYERQKIYKEQFEKLDRLQRKELEIEIANIQKELSPNKTKKNKEFHPLLFAEKAESYFSQLRDFHKKYFAEHNSITKKLIKSQIEQIELEFIKSSIKEKVDEIETRIKNLNFNAPDDRQKNTDLMREKLEYMAIPDTIKNSNSKPYFLWKLNFFEVFQEKNGFDVLIGNPPYKGFRDLDKKIKHALQKNYVSAEGKFDLYIPFIERGLNLLNKNGFLTYICPTAFTKREHAEQIRKFLLEKSTVREIIDFGHDQIFEQATNYTGIFSFIKAIPEKNQFQYRYGFSEKYLLVNQEELSSDSWIFADPLSQNIINKINQHPKLENIAKISEGIVTGLNDLYLKSNNEIKTENFETKYFYPCHRGKEIGKYFLRNSLESVFYPYSYLNNKTQLVEEKKLVQEVPRYLKYLNKNRDLIMKRGYFKKSNKKWYELWNQRDMNNFLVEKIITPELSDRNRFMLSDKKCFYGDTVCGIILKDEFKNEFSLLYLLAILNSSLIEWFYKKTTVPKAGGFFIYKVMYLNNIPIKSISLEKQKPFIDNVSKILQLAKIKNYDAEENSILNNDVRDINLKLNNMVMDLYGLTPEEIYLVCESFKESEQG